jgi:hypothetical protein
MTLLGELALYVLECIGAAIAIVGVLVIAFYSIVIAVIAILYAIVWGVAISCAALDRSSPPKRMQPRCPKCDSAKVFGEPGHRVCTNCGAFQSGDLT